MQALMSMQGEREPMDQSGTYAAKAADEGALDAWKSVVGAREGRARMANDRGANRETLANALARAQMLAELERARQGMVKDDHAADRDMKWKLDVKDRIEKLNIFNREGEQYKDKLSEADKERANKLNIAKTHRTYPPAARAAGGGGVNPIKSIESSVNGLIKQSTDLTQNALTWNASTEGRQMAQDATNLASAMNDTKAKLEQAKVMFFAGRQEEAMQLWAQASEEAVSLAAMGNRLKAAAPKTGAPGAAQQSQAPKPAWNEDGPQF